MRFSCGFSSAVKGSRIIKNYDMQYYFQNYDKCLTQQGIPQASVRLNGKNINLVGIPIMTDSQDVFQQVLNDLQEVHNKHTAPGTQYLVQMDPTPFLYNRRYLSQQYLKTHQPQNSSIIEDYLLKDTPTLPLNVEELQGDFRLLDLVHLIDSTKGADLSSEQKQVFAKILEGSGQGYFSKYLSEQNIVQNELMDPEFEKNYAKVQEKAFFYQFESNNRISKAYLSLCLMLSMLTQATYLGDLSKMYLRIYAGRHYDLLQLRDLFKQYVSIKAENPQGPVYIPLEASQVAWRQQLKDYYLLLTINYLANKKELENLTVYCENVHLEPLKDALLTQNGTLIKDIEETYHSNMKYPAMVHTNTDEEMIEKHVLLDMIDEHPIWKESLIRNPFPYLSQNYNELGPEDKREVQKTFYKYHNQYSRVVNQVIKP